MHGVGRRLVRVRVRAGQGEGWGYGRVTVGFGGVGVGFRHVFRLGLKDLRVRVSVRVGARGGS